MTEPNIVECQVHLGRRGRGARRVICPVNDPDPAVPAGRVPRVSRYMALALRFEGLVRSGQVSDYAELARMGHVSRARMTQIMNLTLLATDIQEEILFFPNLLRGRDPIRLHQVQAIAAASDWQRQRKLWRRMLRIR